MEYNFKWDTQKAKSNVNKHGVSFGQAAEIFLDERQLTIYDGEHSDTEDRWITLGKTKNGTLLVAIHTFTEDSESIQIRFISARPPTKREQRQYEEN